MVSGKAIQQFDYSRDGDEKEFVCSAVSPSGQSVVIGSFDRYSRTCTCDTCNDLCSYTCTCNDLCTCTLY